MMHEAGQLIGLAGRAGAGKDAVAALLTMRGYKRFAFADALRLEVADALRARTVPDGVDWPDLAIDALRHADQAEVYAKPTTPRMRCLLQWWGTEYRRNCFGQTYWLDIMADAIRGEEKVVISDVRLPNEVAFVRLRGGQAWEIQRETASAASAEHISEQLRFTPNWIISNNGTLEALARQVLHALKEEA